MRACLIFMVLCLLSGCAGGAPRSARLSAAQAAPGPEEFETALSIALSEFSIDDPVCDDPPDHADAGAMGELLCAKALPGGAEVVCFREPGSLSVKYWAIRSGGSLLRFCREDSCYDEGYDITPFTNVLGRDGFCIHVPRGATYTACDYYTLDDAGIPRLLAGCAGRVLEADFNLDGTSELMWFYHGAHEIYYYALLDGRVVLADLTGTLLEQYGVALFGGDADALSDTPPAGSALAVTYASCGGRGSFAGALSRAMPAQLSFTPETVEVQIPRDNLWSLNLYELSGGIPRVKSPGAADWAPIGPAVAAPESWKTQPLAGRDTVKTWAEVTPAFTQLEMVSADDGWLVLSIGHGIGGMDTYSYRTHDGGKTWAEASPLPENAWLPDKCAFLDGLHAVVTTKVFQGAPVFATNDGGKTWLEVALPLPKDQTVQPVDLRLSGGGLYLTMAWNSPGGAHQTITLSSRDLGQTWSADEPR